MERPQVRRCCILVPMNPYRTLFSALNDASVRYIVVGGVAVNLHGYRRFTGDIDILLALDADNLEKATAIMHQLGYVERLPVQLRELADESTMHRFLEEKGMTAYTFLSGSRERIDVDILASASLHFEEYEGRHVILDIDEGVQVPVVSIGDLIQMKQEARRDKDMLDIQALLELKGL